MGAGFYKLRSHLGGIEKSGAGDRHIEAPGALGADSILDKTGCGRQHHIRRYRSHDDKVDSGRIDSGLIYYLLGRFGSQIRSSHTFIDDMPGENTGTLYDPVIGGFHHLLKVLISQKTRWNSHPHGCYLGSRHFEKTSSVQLLIGKD